MSDIFQFRLKLNSFLFLFKLILKVFLQLNGKTLDKGGVDIVSLQHFYQRNKLHL